ncbi:MAG: hypothetical protein ACI8XC_003483 [Gammaproteobacteria bacterium]|jgi:hypothetical protein
MKNTLLIVFLLSQSVWAADIKSTSLISCISDESRLLGRRLQTVAQTDSDNSDRQIIEWVMKENFGDARSKIEITWTPKGEKGPEIALETTDRPNNSVRIRSRTASSLIFISSTSNFYSAESWTFVINFNMETMMATRVLSNSHGVGSEQIAYRCRFDSIS